MLRFFAAPETVHPAARSARCSRPSATGTADAGVVPVESSLLGTIRENLDLLWAFDLPIAGEVTVPVRLALLGLPGERLETVERVYSIAAALAQADEFLRSRPWTIQTTYNTAGAAKQVAERGERGSAAVASRPGRADLRPRDPRRRHPVRRGQPDPVRGDRAARATTAGSRGGATGVAVAGAAADDARVRRPQRPGQPPPLARRVRDPRPQPVPPRVTAVDRARLALGVPVLGRPRRGPGRARLRRGARRARPRDRDRPDPRHVSPRPPRTTARTWNGGAGRGRAPPWSWSDARAGRTRPGSRSGERRWRTRSGSRAIRTTRTAAA